MGTVNIIESESNELVLIQNNDTNNELVRIVYDPEIDYYIRLTRTDAPIIIPYTFKEHLTVTAIDTVTDLSKTPLSYVMLLVYSVVETDASVNPPFTIEGKSIIWDATNAGYILEIGDPIVAIYETIE